MDYAIEVSGLTKFFPSGNSIPLSLSCCFRRSKIQAVVKNVSFRVGEGQGFGLIGPNGAGKSTLMRILCCLILPSEGTARVAGYDILRQEMQVKRLIGFVGGQERSFYWRLTGRQNLDFFASLYGIRRRDARQRINDLCGLLGIEEADKRFQEYSAGMKQRLALARSLLHSPQILFMDEPTKSLDPWCAEKLRFFIKDNLVRQKKMTVFLATHDLEEAGELCASAALMDAGEIKVYGRTEEVLKGLA